MCRRSEEDDGHEDRTHKPATVQAAIDECLTTIAERLERAAAVANSAVACVHEGNREEAVAIVMGVEDMIAHVNTFLNAAALINRNAEF